MSRLDGKVAVVTGSTSGIGRGIAEHFAGLGADVVVHGLNREDGLETVRRVKAAGRDAEYVEGDLTSEEVCRGLIRHAVKRFGGLEAFDRTRTGDLGGRCCARLGNDRDQPNVRAVASPAREPRRRRGGLASEKRTARRRHRGADRR